MTASPPLRPRPAANLGRSGHRPDHHHHPYFRVARFDRLPYVKRGVSPLPDNEVHPVLSRNFTITWRRVSQRSPRFRSRIQRFVCGPGEIERKMIREKSGPSVLCGLCRKETLPGEPHDEDMGPAPREDLGTAMAEEGFTEKSFPCSHDDERRFLSLRCFQDRRGNVTSGIFSGDASHRIPGSLMRACCRCNSSFHAR